ncbi:Mu transposase C-terminal domain-containing protein [Ideonella sp. BN130291]|uniref:Mu transposase C-terminal domain-containing protein n=1 Tax=Ideonella sp. BN130291 TaxID=3112940 RepID=UPI002E25D3C6|nr:Mu transposase C-terminal domain-containing protein [Ideonella sp. BN130291]
MGAFSFRVGLVFEWAGVQYQIGKLHQDEQVLLEQVDNGSPRLVTRRQLLDAYCDAGPAGVRATVVEEVRRLHFARPMSDLPSEVQAEVRRRKHYIDVVAEQGRPSFSVHYLRPLLDQAAAAIGDEKSPSVPTFWRWWRRYQLNQDVRALAPHSRARLQRTGQSEMFDLLREAIAEAMAISPLANATTVHTALARRVDAANRRRLDEDQLRMPCLRTVQRLLNDAPKYDLAVLREGKAAADRKFRVVVRSVKTNHVLERVEVDHTPLDLFLIDEKTMLPLGRPIVTILIDHKSRMVLGYYIGFGQPSTAAVMSALRHAILPKKPAEPVIPGLMVVNAWTCYGRPLALILDNGLEFHSTDLESVALDLGITLQFCPKREPRFKGVVERFLRTLNYSFAHQLPGTSFARLHQRGDYDPAKHALMTMAEFRHVFEKWLLDIYGQSVHRGVKGIPLALWNEGAERVKPELPPDRAALQRRIGMVEERALQHYGIDLHNVRYCGPSLSRLLDIHGPGTPVRVVLDPDDIGEIQVWGPQDHEPVSVRAKLYAEYQGITLAQARFMHEKTKEMGLANHDAAALRQAKAELSESVLQLLGSRKQRDRRRSAALRGLSATRPTEPVTPKSATRVTQLPPARPPRPSSPPAEPPPVQAAGTEISERPSLLLRFTLKSKRIEP